MTGKAFMTMFYATGDKTWLNYTIKANRYYLGKMRWNSPDHPFMVISWIKPWRENSGSVFSGLSLITSSHYWLSIP